MPVVSEMIESLSETLANLPPWAKAGIAVVGVAVAYPLAKALQGVSTNPAQGCLTWQIGRGSVSWSRHRPRTALLREKAYTCLDPQVAVQGGLGGGSRVPLPVPARRVHPEHQSLLHQAGDVV